MSDIGCEVSVEALHPVRLGKTIDGWEEMSSSMLRH